MALHTRTEMAIEEFFNEARATLVDWLNMQKEIHGEQMKALRNMNISYSAPPPEIKVKRVGKAKRRI